MCAWLWCFQGMSETALRNNDYEWVAVLSTGLPLCVTVLTNKKKKCNPNQLQGEASLIKNKDVQTPVYCYTRFQWLLSALKKEPDTADLI